VKIRGHTYVDGALLRTVHASLVLDQGADLVFSINPLVTFDATHSSTRHSDLSAEGLSVVMGQTFRALIQSRMQIGMATYRKRYPHSDRLLLQPDRHDETMFFANVFRYSERRRLADHAYQRTRRDMLAQEAVLGPLLERHGIRLRPERLRDTRRSFHTSVEDRHAPTQMVSRKLMHTLDRLSRWVRAPAA
jgi:NTE family protein